MIDDAEAVAVSSQAIRTSLNCDPSTGEICALDAVALLETSRGDGWKGAGLGSNNQGAIQCGPHWQGDKFTYTDTHPNADGTSTPYSVDFRKYATRLDGLIDLVQVMYVQHGRTVVRAAAIAQNWMGVSQTMHDTGYYEGFGPTVADRVANHNRALMKGVNRDLIALGKSPASVVVSAAVVPETLRLGDSPRNAKGAAVAELQRELGIAADGIFGEETLQTLLDFQADAGLETDGVCGPETWAALFARDPQ